MKFNHMGLNKALQPTAYFVGFFTIFASLSLRANAESVTFRSDGGIISAGCTNSGGRATGTSAFIANFDGLTVLTSRTLASDRFVPDIRPQGYREFNQTTFASVRVSGTVQEQYRINGSIVAITKASDGTMRVSSRGFAARPDCDPKPKPGNVAQPPSPPSPPTNPPQSTCIRDQGGYCVALL